MEKPTEPIENDEYVTDDEQPPPVVKKEKKKREYVMTPARAMAIEKMKTARALKVAGIKKNKENDAKILKNAKTLTKPDEPDVNEPEPIKKKATKKPKKQVIVFDDSSESDEENQIVIKRKRKKTPPKVEEVEEEEEFPMPPPIQRLPRLNRL